MKRLRWPRSQTIWPLLLAPLLIVACSDPAGPPSADPASGADQHPVPFHEGEASALTSSSAVSRDKTLQSQAGLPFQDSQNLPAGTLLTVRLKDSVSAGNPQAGSTFEAVIDKPVVIEGNMLVPRGASVAGRVESARASEVQRNRGYVRLTLQQIALAGRDLPIQTSSLFARANAEVTGDSQDPSQIHLEKGRRLTFRLTEPVYVVGEASAPTR